jgi:hypothetical protein
MQPVSCTIFPPFIRIHVYVDRVVDIDGKRKGLCVVSRCSRTGLTSG